MRHSTLFVVLTGACTAFSGHQSSSTHTASASEDAKRAAEYIASVEQDLPDLKATALDTFKSLERQRIAADEESDKYEELAEHEGDARMKQVMYGFRDAFRSHTKVLAQIEERLHDLGIVGKDLELDVELYHVLEGDVREIIQGGLSPQKMSSLVASTKQGLSLLQEKTSISTKAIRDTENLLDVETSATLKYKKELRQLSAFSGDSKDFIKQWEKQVIQTELNNNTGEAKGLATVSSLARRIEATKTKIDSATKVLQLSASRE